VLPVGGIKEKVLAANRKRDQGISFFRIETGMIWKRSRRRSGAASISPESKRWRRWLKIALDAACRAVV